MSEFVDGRRWPSPQTSGEAPADRRDLPADQQPAEGAPADFPTFDVYAGFLMRPDTIALHFPLTAAPALCALFPTEAGKIHAAALLVEQEAEWDADHLRGRQLAGGGA